MASIEMNGAAHGTPHNGPLPLTDEPTAGSGCRSIAAITEQGHLDLVEVLADTSRVGTAAHALIAYLAMRFGTPTPQQVFQVGRASIGAPRLGIPSRQALRAQVVSRAAVYFRAFARPGWRLVGSEVVADEAVAFDLLWTRDGCLEADEVKTGRLRPVDLLRLHDQAQAQLEAGLQEYGAAFTAVRAVVLTRPATSFVLRP